VNRTLKLKKKTEDFQRSQDIIKQKTEDTAINKFLKLVTKAEWTKTTFISHDPDSEIMVNF
jgi:hypothetical protein